MEEWKEIKGYEGIYYVSSKGRVRTTIRRGCSVEFLKQGTNVKGYALVYLCKNKKKKTFFVHRLVAMAFLPNPNGYPEVNHKDENKKNNCVNNLEWCTHDYNVRYGTGIERGISALRRKVNQYSFDGCLIKTYVSMKSAARETGFDSACLCRCCNGKTKTYNGFIWLYQDTENLEKVLQERLLWASNSPTYGKEKRVYQYTLEKKFVDVYKSMREASRCTGIHSTSICESIKKQRPRSGYFWSTSPLEIQV